MDKTIITNCAKDTSLLGFKLASILKNGATLTLSGDLGAGKTTFVRGLAEGLGIKEVVQSPTFNIMKVYLKGNRPLIHIDAYRLEDISTDIGLDEYIGYETGITVIEWPQFIKELLPNDSINVNFKHLGDDKREIAFSNISKEVEEVL